jgi:hypothetical protein
MSPLLAPSPYTPQIALASSTAEPSAGDVKPTTGASRAQFHDASGKIQRLINYSMTQQGADYRVIDQLHLKLAIKVASYNPLGLDSEVQTFALFEHLATQAASMNPKQYIEHCQSLLAGKKKSAWNLFEQTSMDKLRETLVVRANTLNEVMYSDFYPFSFMKNQSGFLAVIAGAADATAEMGLNSGLMTIVKLSNPVQFATDAIKGTLGLPEGLAKLFTEAKSIAFGSSQLSDYEKGKIIFAAGLTLLALATLGVQGVKLANKKIAVLKLNLKSGKTLAETIAILKSSSSPAAQSAIDTLPYIPVQPVAPLPTVTPTVAPKPRPVPVINPLKGVHSNKVYKFLVESTAPYEAKVDTLVQWIKSASLKDLAALEGAIKQAGKGLEYWQDGRVTGSYKGEVFKRRAAFAVANHHTEDLAKASGDNFHPTGQEKPESSQAAQSAANLKESASKKIQNLSSKELELLQGLMRNETGAIFQEKYGWTLKEFVEVRKSLLYKLRVTNTADAITVASTAGASIADVTISLKSKKRSEKKLSTGKDKLHEGSIPAVSKHPYIDVMDSWIHNGLNEEAAVKAMNKGAQRPITIDEFRARLDKIANSFGMTPLSFRKKFHLERLEKDPWIKSLKLTPTELKVFLRWVAFNFDLRALQMTSGTKEASVTRHMKSIAMKFNLSLEEIKEKLISEGFPKIGNDTSGYKKTSWFLEKPLRSDYQAILTTYVESGLNFSQAGKKLNVHSAEVHKIIGRISEHFGLTREAFDKKLVQAGVQRAAHARHEPKASPLSPKTQQIVSSSGLPTPALTQKLVHILDAWIANGLNSADTAKQLGLDSTYMNDRIHDLSVYFGKSTKELRQALIDGGVVERRMSLTDLTRAKHRQLYVNEPWFTSVPLNEKLETALEVWLKNGMNLQRTADSLRKTVAETNNLLSQISAKFNMKVTQLRQEILKHRTQ